MPDRTGTPAHPWHALLVRDVLEKLGVDERGLSTDEAEARLERHGPNRLAAVPPVSPWRILLDQFTSVVVLLLLGAMALAFLVGEHLESAAIAVVLVLNTGLGFAVELNARRAMEGLLRYQVPSSRVVRDGAVTSLPSDLLVPGDVVELEAGDSTPADIRLVSAAELRVDEASLTGESVPVEKTPDPTESDVPLAERASMVHAGTTVVAGRARGVVVATGAGTELGRVGALLATVESGETPLERRLDALGRRLVGVAVAAAGAVVGLGAIQGAPVARMVEAGIALAIAAVPEGLPAVVTIALAVGLRRMARRKALVRRLVAVEALGSTTVVCTDKTGTLTAGEMTATRVVTPDAELRVTGTGYGAGGEVFAGTEPLPPERPEALTLLFQAAALTARATVDAEGQASGDPTDAALLVLSRKAGLDRDALLAELPETGEVPFSSAARLSATFHRRGDGTVAFVKGDPARILERSAAAATKGGDVPMDAALRHRLEAANEAMSGEGLRVIAIAAGDASGGALPETFTLLGLVGMMDPPAEGVADTLGVLRAAGVRTVMITGDQARTAAAVARSVGMLDEGAETLDGKAVASLDAADLVRHAERTAIFSRVSPEDKLRIVEAMQERGEIVAMLGDGVNDAAALKRADVGVAMGIRGTDVAKETADLVLQDDRFATIGAAMEEGRVIYDNIRKFVFYLFSCNLAEVLVLLGGGLVGLPLPLLPLQILWLNLVTDTFPALALALEPGEPDVMRRPPRDPGATLLSRRFVGSMLFFAALITASTLTAYVWGLGTGPAERAVTVSFMTLALAQLFHLGNARSRWPVLRPSRIVANPWALASVPLVLGLQVLTVTWAPLSRVLGTTSLAPGDWVVVLSLAVVPAVVGQGVELLQAHRRRT